MSLYNSSVIYDTVLQLYDGALEIVESQVTAATVDGISGGILIDGGTVRWRRRLENLLRQDDEILVIACLIDV
jgi:hypothetical protein